MTADTTAGGAEETIAELRRLLALRDAELAERNTQFAERIDHQAATIDVLKAMSASPGDPQPVFDLIVRQAQALCGSRNASLFEYDGTMVHHRAWFFDGGWTDPNDTYIRRFSRPMTRDPDFSVNMAILEGRTIHIRDSERERGIAPDARAGGVRAGAVVPIFRDGTAVGAIALTNHQPGGFSDTQMALLQTFSEQAAIAITSAETFRALHTRTADLQESLEYQTATSDVLKVISRSTYELRPVLDTLGTTAMRLVEADMTNISLREGDSYRMVVNVSVSTQYDAWYRDRVLPANRETLVGRTIVEGKVVHIADLTADPEYVVAKATASEQLRTILGVPMMRDGETIGVIAVARRRVEPYTDRQIELIRTFADQAVIALENVRLLNEQRKALDRQTATAEVLEVINASPGDLTPVFDAILEKAHRICRFEYGGLALFDGTHFRNVATRGYGEAGDAISRTPYLPAGAQRLVLRGARYGHIPDIPAFSPDPDDNAFADFVAATGFRATLLVPLRRDGAVVGHISGWRREAGAFSDKEIALLENFAAQAVIAMENARLLTEQREALERQTATAELLGVINASPGDLKPVFDTLLENALRMGGGTIGGIFTIEGNRSITRALKGVTPAFAAFQERYPVDEIQPGTVPARILDTRRPVQSPDVRAGETYRKGFPYSRALVDLGNIRAVLAVPLLKEGAAVGMITLYREEPGPFADKQISLLENFAAQAVIAMENARLLTETREALERQTATADVLQVINANPGDPGPVFDAILESAHRVCGASIGSLWLYDGELTYAVATRGMTEQDAATHRRPRPMSPAQRTVLIDGARYFHSADRRFDGVVLSSDIVAAGVQTVLGVPLVKDGRPIGVIGARRLEARPFADREIELLESFAAQAVIAMENARLLTETREALERQTATAEVLQVINANPGDLAPVFQTMLDRAVRLCGADFGESGTIDNDVWTTRAVANMPMEFARVRMNIQTRPGPGTSTWHLIRGENVFHVPDLMETEAYRNGEPARRAMVDIGGARGLLSVALRRDDALLGQIAIMRREPGPFSDRQIALLENFAAQAVIAMENARLLTETREALERQTATAEILQVINANPGETTPVFHAILEKSLALAESAFGAIWLYDGEFMRAAATRGMTQALAAFNAQNPIQRISTSARQATETGRSVQLADMREGVAYRSGHPASRAFGDLGGARANLVVPLIKERETIGCIHIFRQEVRPFSDKQVALLEGFAAQAVIAIENARLLTEQAEALERQTAVADVLQVINRSPGDLTPVFNAMLERAFRLCDAEAGALWVIEGEIVTVGAFGGFSDAVSAFLSQPFIPGPETGIGRLMAGEDLVQIADLAKGLEYLADEPMHRLAVDNDGLHALTAVPLRKDGVFLGAFGMMRRQPGHFTDKQISLLRDFAAQAVIAMENARLLNEIRQRQGELDVTFQSMGDGVALFDETHHLAAWNQNFQDLIEVPADIVSSKPSFKDYIQYLADRGEYGPNSGDIVGRLLAQAGRHAAFERTRPNGRVIRIRTNPTPTGGFVVMYTDVTESKRAEDALRAARDAAENTLRELKIAQANLVQAEKMASLGQLTAGIAHEIKNPLNFVNNFAALSVDLLEELKETAAPGFATLTDDQRADIDDVSAMLTTNLQKITEHGKRADGIVKAMLEHSRGSSGERRAVDINVLVDEALNLAYHGARAQDQGFNITLERDYAEGIAPIEVNPQDLTRVFLNLLSNGFYAADKQAKERTEPGFEPVLRVSTRSVNDTVEISIRDNGTGIPADIRDKLFQPFFTTKPTGEGTGLGLSITYDIVTKQHGGTITIDSEVGVFTEFVVTLPREMFGGEGARP